MMLYMYIYQIVLEQCCSFSFIFRNVSKSCHLIIWSMYSKMLAKSSFCNLDYNLYVFKTSLQKNLSPVFLYFQNFKKPGHKLWSSLWSCTMMATNHDSHRPQTMTMMATAMKRRCEKLNAKCTVKLISHRWINFTELVVMVRSRRGCGHHGLWPSLSNS